MTAAGPTDHSLPTSIDYALFVANCGPMPDGGAGGNETDAGTSDNGGGKTW